MKGLDPSSSHPNISPTQKDVLKIYKCSFDLFFKVSFCNPSPQQALNGIKLKINKPKFSFET